MSLSRSPQPAQPLVGSSSVMQSVRKLISLVASSTATVLITGESGTGKELIARALHEQSERRSARFVPINCGAIPKDLIESELFGHRKGAFTGALADRIGRFEMAHGGTIFLDEIGDLPMEMQVKILRVLQERVVDAVGASHPVPIDVRVIAATHRDLEAEVAAGRFREDLYYRLNVLPVVSPALRERAEDVPELLQHHARRLARPGLAAISFEADTVKALQGYSWPGNVRELSNLVDRYTTLFPGRCICLTEVPETMVPRGLREARLALIDALPTARVLHLFGRGAAQGQAVQSGASHPSEDDALHAAFDGVATPKPAAAEPEPGGAPHGAQGASSIGKDHGMGDASPWPSSEVATEVETAIMLAQGTEILPPDGISLRERLAEIERSLIEQALARTGGNVSQTARLLNLQRTTLIEKLNKHDLRAA